MWLSSLQTCSHVRSAPSVHDWFVYPKANAMLGTPLSSIPLYTSASRQLDVAAVDVQPDPAERHHLQPGGGDDDVGFDLVPRRDPAHLGEGLDLVGHDLGLAFADRLEKIAIGHETEALIPGGVARQ